VAAVSPRIHRETTGGCRKCRVVRFRYALIFRERNGEVQIIAIMHMKRRPDYWKSAICALVSRCCVADDFAVCL
jgi:plasmid stabilization system protein ParE